jgi:uncharacterized protein (TIGR02217 family)
MSTAILPSLAGLGFDVTRAPVWDTTVQQAISGKETRIAKLTYPRWKWDLTYSVLRSGAAFGELQQLAGFFNARQGMFDTFLYQDADDNGVTGQQIATGDGATTSFQLIRAFGGFIEPVLAPNLSQTINVYVNGALQASGTSVMGWGASSPSGPGMLTFAAAPASGAIVTADFSYYFPVRMSEDSVSFDLFMLQYYKAKKFSFISVKN